MHQDKDDIQARVLSLVNKGIEYSEKGQFEKAVEQHVEALELYRQIDDKQGEASQHQHIARCLCALEKYDEALEHAHTAKRIGTRRAPGVSSVHAMVFNLQIHDDIRRIIALKYKGQSFQVQEESKEIRCPRCGSTDVHVRPKTYPVELGAAAGLASMVEPPPQNRLWRCPWCFYDWEHTYPESVWEDWAARNSTRPHL